MHKYDYDFFKVGAEYILNRINFIPEIAIILGSDLGNIAEKIKNKTIIEYSDIPNFLLSTVESHQGKLILGELEGKNVVCMAGRFHYYEGYDFEQLTIPVRILKLIGIKKLILTNIVGAVNRNYQQGDLMLIKDHIKLNGASPLRGYNVKEFGPRFFDVTDMYSQTFRELALKCAEELDIMVHEGVYFFMPGPQFETKAEINLISMLGGDVVGMSTVTEALTAAHCGIETLGISLIVNMAAGVTSEKISVKEVEHVVSSCINKMEKLLCQIVRKI